MYLLGYDIGSSSLKAALVDAETGEVVATASHPETEMEMLSLQSGWAEQLPEVWWQNLCIVTKKLLGKSGVDAADLGAKEYVRRPLSNRQTALTMNQPS